MKKEYFTRFPNKYIQGNINTRFGVSRKFYITYILIDRYRSYENFSWITVKKVLKFYGYKTTRRKAKAFSEILDVLEYMINNKMIEVTQDLDAIDYDTGIEIKIIPENFDAVDNFCKISASQIDVIMTSESSINKENLLLAFLYINSYIYVRPKDDDGKEKMINPSDKPEVFWKSVDKMAQELAMSKTTVSQCINCLTEGTGDNQPLLVKKEVGSVQPDADKPPKNLPNIYALNKDGYAQEIEWALSKVYEVYGLGEFSVWKNENSDYNISSSTERDKN